LPKKIIFISVIFLALLLQGCGILPSAMPVYDIEDYPQPIGVMYYNNPKPLTEPRVLTPGMFTLRFDPNSSFNPLTTLNRDNMLVTSLLFETLFELDRNLIPRPVLVENWTYLDGMNLELEIKQGIIMADGNPMTANDVAYSIRQAARIGRFANRFRSLSSVTVTDDYTVLIELTAPNRRFHHLLDIPIMRNGTSGQSQPVGTGPYRFLFQGATHLSPDPNSRFSGDLPLRLINLRECLDTQLTELFDTGELSLLWDDPHDFFEIRLNRLRETRYFETTNMVFLGFNSNHVALQNPDIRRAIGVAIDRTYITENIMRPGLTIPSPLALSPAFHLYDEAWEHMYFPPLEIMGVLLLNRAGLVYSDDPFLSLPDGLGGYRPFTIDFIVNIENPHKVRTAYNIANTLRRNGLNTIVRELPWDRFVSALNSGNFDMFLGEIQLGADFDLTPLLLPGPLNFGGTASTIYEPFLSDFLASATDDELRWSAQRLITMVTENAPFAPILFKRHAVYSPIGAISGANPSQTNVFFNITDWNVNLYMLN